MNSPSHGIFSGSGSPLIPSVPNFLSSSSSSYPGPAPRTKSRAVGEAAREIRKENTNYDNELNVLKGIYQDHFNKIKYIYFEHHYDLMIKKNYKYSDVKFFLNKRNFFLAYKVKMQFRKTFEYIYENKNK